MSNKKVFVYGSLKKGYGNHRLLEDAKYLGTHVTDPAYTMVGLGGFPGVILTGDTSIHGELYEVTPMEFEYLDGLEGYPSFYNRTKISTDHGEAWMYYLDDEYLGYEKINEGVW